MVDLSIQQRCGFGLAAIMARKGAGAGEVGRVLGVAAPVRPQLCRGAEGLALIGTGAGTWLAYADDVPPFWAEDLRERLAGIASVSDQSDGYLVTRLEGEGARTALQRGAAIDFHPGAFGPGSAATTVIAHIGAIIWQLDAQPTYDVAVFRSYADSFRHWLDITSAAL